MDTFFEAAVEEARKGRDAGGRLLHHRAAVSS
jgi:hypothetical protein